MSETGRPDAASPTRAPLRPAPPSPRQMLTRILETPELVAAVRALPPRVLGRLIDQVGLEDAGGLVALASTEQLQAVFDEDLWTRERPGGDEHFDADRFALWLEVMLETGEDFVARKLAELPVDLCTYALHRQILVVNADELMVEMSEPGRDVEILDKALDSCLYHELDEYQIISRNDRVWDAILAALLALDREHHDLLRRLLARCCALSSALCEENGGLHRVLTAEESLEADLAGEREDRRAAQGFIAPASARSFLALARGSTLEELATRPRDAVTRAYFRELERKGGASPAAAREERAPERARAAPLFEVLREAEVLCDEPRVAARLEGRKPTGAAPFQGGLVALTMPRLLERSPEHHTRRIEELAYLANVLGAGASVGGRGLRPFEAARAALATSSLGLEHLLARGLRAPAAREARALELLAGSGAERLFLLGLRLLHELALEAGLALARLAEEAGALGLLGAARSARARASVREVVAAGKPWLARRWLDELEVEIDAPARPALRALLDELPARAQQPELEPMESLGELQAARRFLATLRLDPAGAR